MENKQIATQNQITAEELDTQITALIKSPLKGLAYNELEIDSFLMIESFFTPEKLARYRKLEGKKFGFTTALKGDGPMSEGLLKDAMIEAFRLGLSPTGNNFTVFAGGTVYATQVGCKTLLDRIGVTLTKESYPLSFIDSKGRTISKPTIEYIYEGKNKAISDEFVIDVTGSTKEDFIRGKAKRKIYKALYESLTGRQLRVVDSEDADVEIVSSKVGSDPNAEKVNSAQGDVKNKSSEDGTFIPEMLSKDNQDKFDGFLLKSTDLTDLYKKVNTILNTPKMKDELHVVYTLVDGVLKSDNIDLTVYNELVAKFKA